MKRIGLACAAMFVLAGCATPMDWAATGGSRADGTVKLSYEYGEFQNPQLNEMQAVSIATRRCQAWGYSGAEAFGGITRQCNQWGGIGGCSRWTVTKEFQCTGTGTPVAQLIGPPVVQQPMMQAAPVPAHDAASAAQAVERDPAKRCDSCGKLSVP